MKKLFTLILFSLFIFSIGCNATHVKKQNDTSKSQSPSEQPEQVVTKFLDNLQQQNYSSAKKYYVENLDNMANFHNQIEAISPSIANKLFDKLANFTYTIENSNYSVDNSSEAKVYITINYYDVGKAFESTLLDYTKNNISMTYDGETDDAIDKKADELILGYIESSTQTTIHHLPIMLTLENNNWKVSKISENPELLNALSGNIPKTINALKAALNPS